MIPTGFQKKARWATLLSAAVLYASVSLASCRTYPLPQPGDLQTPAEDRLFDGLLSSLTGWGSSGSGSGWGSGVGNMPDVAGFGMYPLWKFHKFDGLSLRPVPYGVDIGTGLPPIPAPPSYPTPSASPAPCGNSGPCRQNYGPPPVATPTTYEPAPTTPTYNIQPLDYSKLPPPTINYAPAVPGPMYQQVPANYPVITSLAPPPGYNPTAAYESAAPGWTAPLNINMGYPEPQVNYVGGSNYGGNSAQGYDQGSNAITIQFGQASQDYGMQSNYMQAGSMQMPSYAALENPLAVSYPSDPKPLTMEAGFGGISFSKRQDATKTQTSESNSNDSNFNPAP